MKCKLSTMETSLIPSIIEILEKSKGEHTAKTNTEITDYIFKTTGITVSDAGFRKIIRHIRVNNLIPFLASSSKGYYIENDRGKMYDYIISLEQRAESIRTVASALRTQMNK